MAAASDAEVLPPWVPAWAQTLGTSMRDPHVLWGLLDRPPTQTAADQRLAARRSVVDQEVVTSQLRADMTAYQHGVGSTTVWPAGAAAGGQYTAFQCFAMEYHTRYMTTLEKVRAHKGQAGVLAAIQSAWDAATAFHERYKQMAAELNRVQAAPEQRSPQQAMWGAVQSPPRTPMRTVSRADGTTVFMSPFAGVVCSPVSAHAHSGTATAVPGQHVPEVQFAQFPEWGPFGYGRYTVQHTARAAKGVGPASSTHSLVVGPQLLHPTVQAAPRRGKTANDAHTVPAEGAAAVATAVTAEEATPVTKATKRRRGA
jgi:hypothetical protein